MFYERTIVVEVCIVLLFDPSAAAMVLEHTFAYHGAMKNESTDDRSVQCGECGGKVLDAPGAALQDRLPCPSCGSMSRNVALSFRSDATIRSSLGVKAKAGGKGNPS